MAVWRGPSEQAELYHQKRINNGANRKNIKFLTYQEAFIKFWKIVKFEFELPINK